jgi:hypothetical protein
MMTPTPMIIPKPGSHADLMYKALQEAGIPMNAGEIVDVINRAHGTGWSAADAEGKIRIVDKILNLWEPYPWVQVRKPGSNVRWRLAQPGEEQSTWFEDRRQWRVFPHWGRLK